MTISSVACPNLWLIASFSHSLLTMSLSIYRKYVLATDHVSRPPAAQSRSELSLATRSGPRTMEATRGNGYTPVRGMPAMMMMICRRFYLIVASRLATEKIQYILTNTYCTFHVYIVL